MPVLRCPDCSLVIAWRGKQLQTPCPGDHPDRFDAPLLHVDRTLATGLNGDEIDVSRSGVKRRERASEAYERRMARLT